jgi:predicted RNase H-like nuclease (RuvC/YqgF family)
MDHHKCFDKFLNKRVSEINYRDSFNETKIEFLESEKKRLENEVYELKENQKHLENIMNNLDKYVESEIKKRLDKII